MRRLFIVGMCSQYGGAGSELLHQIVLWHQCFKDIELHIIPTMQGVENEPLYRKMVAMGIKFHGCRDYSEVTKDDAIINFCSSQFLDDLVNINYQTKRTCFTNCMTFLFPKEKEAASQGLISHFLYQRDGVLQAHRTALQLLGSDAEFLLIQPYFDSSGFKFSVKDQDKTHIGRISRQDSDKFSKNTLHIYEYIVSPKMKQGHFLGFDERSKAKIGPPYDWIKTYKDQTELPVEKFYDTVDFIVQSTDTTENLPRIGFEAMMTGKPLVVDNRGGWKHMIEHGKTGFLCNHERDFIYFGSRLAYDLDLRDKIAHAAYKSAQDMASMEVSKASWQKVFDSLFS